MRKSQLTWHQEYAEHQKQREGPYKVVKKSKLLTKERRSHQQQSSMTKTEVRGSEIIITISKWNGKITFYPPKLSFKNKSVKQICEQIKISRYY